MPGFIKKFIAEWRSLEIDDTEPLIVAFSGGADSCALLISLTEIRKSGKIGNRIIAAHFDHGLRGAESVEDRRYCERLAGELGIRFCSERAEPGALSENVEQSARRARYRFLHKAAENEGAKVVLTGHTLNDQAETLLLNLIRGTGHDGISAMAVERPLSNGSSVRLIRPLLKWAKRSATVEFCMEQSIEYRSDPMNEDVSFNRVRIRKQLIPMLEEYNPSIVDGLVRTASMALDTRHALDWFMSNDPTFSETINQTRLPVRNLQSLPPELRQTAAREWLKRRRGSLKKISAAHIGAIVALAESKKSGKTIELPDGLRVVKQDGELELREKQVEKTDTDDYN